MGWEEDGVEIGIRKLSQKGRNQNCGSGGLRGAFGLPKGLRGEDAMC